MTPLETITKRLAEIEARASKATESWKVGVARTHDLATTGGGMFVRENVHAAGPGHSLDDDEDAYEKTAFDVEFLRHSRSDIPALVAALKVAVESIKIMHYECADGCETVNQIAAALGEGKS